MPVAQDQDRYFNAPQDSSTPRHLLGEGSVSRLINSRFVEGAVTNGLDFSELDIDYADGNDVRIYASKVTYKELLDRGDPQLVAPLENINGKFLVVVMSGILLSIDLATNKAYDITPIDANLPQNSGEGHLSYLDNDGGVYGVGGYLVIFNWPNKPIFVTPSGARTSNEVDYEMPPMRMGATAGLRAFTISGRNIMWASDPLGGSNGLAPLTYAETLKEGADFYGETFTIGSVLNVSDITAVCRLPKFLGVSSEFLAQNVLVSTNTNKYIIAAGSPRTSWGGTQFITYAGSTDGIAGPLACTNVGDALIYISTTGRIKTIAQDRQRETGLVEEFFDDGLGQYMCLCENSYYFRDWYRTLDHSRSIVKFSRDRLYATVYPIRVPAINKYGGAITTNSHRALAVSSIDSKSSLGAKSGMSWEGFYDFINPAGIVTLDNDMYVLSKDKYGRNRFYKENFFNAGKARSTIITRGYFTGVTGKGKSISRGSLYFRSLPGAITAKISYMVNGKWVCGSDCVVTKKNHRFSIRSSSCKTESWSIPLKIDLDHNGCRFELESVRVEGESFREERK